MGQEGAQRSHLVAGTARRLAEQIADGVEQTTPDQPQPHQREPCRRGVPGDDHHAELAIDLPGPGTGGAGGPQAGAADLAVAHPGAGSRDDPVAAQMRPPAELDPVAEDRHRRIESVQRVEDLGLEQHAAGRHPEPGLRLVALALVDLAGFEHELAPTGARDARPDLAQPGRRPAAAGLQQLGPGDVDARGRSPRGSTAAAGRPGPAPRRRAGATASSWLGCRGCRRPVAARSAARAAATAAPNP